MHTITVQEVLDLAIEMDMVHLAHRIFWAITNGKVQINDDSKRLDAIDYDDEAISTMTAENRLSIGNIKLYVAETREPDHFAFYFCENVLEANALHQDLFRETPKRLTHALAVYSYYYLNCNNWTLHRHCSLLLLHLCCGYLKLLVQAVQFIPRHSEISNKSSHLSLVRSQRFHFLE